ncbi:hypothetical protein [Clostridium perfringens]|uniref:hypothetical protein n=1 Tax=Clostridium perfringens TaxID=1502 RepID=UPI0018E4AED3|nr:hypothetical protein [Clostridium perfringens]MBI6108948.1 hypothetical protein [Clostridium perfringens]
MKIYTDIIQFIDYILNCISNGKYIYYQINYVPKDKAENEDFLNKLDTKLTKKYNTELTKYQRLNLRRKDQARHLYVRYNNVIVILKTNGATEVAAYEKWNDIRKEKMSIKISNNVTYLIGLGTAKASKNKTLESKITVTLSKDTLNLIKLSCLDAIRYKKSIKKLYYEFNKINGFNGWSGINKQKQQLRDYLVIEVCKNFGIKKKEARKLFRINTFRAKAQKDLDKALILEATENSPPGELVAPKEL